MKIIISCSHRIVNNIVKPKASNRNHLLKVKITDHQMLLCTSSDGAISVQTPDGLHARDVNGQPAATVPPPGNGDAQGEPRLLLQAHRLLLAGEPTWRILHEQ